MPSDDHRKGSVIVPRKGENIYKRKDGRWEARYIHHYENGKAKYVSIYGDSYGEAKAKRLEGIRITVSGDNLGVRYTTHCQTYGWLPWVSNGEMSGTQGEAKRLEAIKIELTGANAQNYDIYYRVHAQSFGWLDWAKNGAPSGTAGYAKRLEGIQIILVPKGQPAPAKNYGGITSVRASYIAK